MMANKYLMETNSGFLHIVPSRVEKFSELLTEYYENGENFKKGYNLFSFFKDCIIL